jgi:hypothetical protein
VRKTNADTSVKGVKPMYPILALLAMMMFTWGAAVWATYADER